MFSLGSSSGSGSQLELGAGVSSRQNFVSEIPAFFSTLLKNLGLGPSLITNLTGEEVFIISVERDEDVLVHLSFVAFRLFLNGRLCEKYETEEGTTVLNPSAETIQLWRHKVLLAFVEFLQ